jgi:hypothetical protein
MPITASPEASINPSRIAAAIPRTSSVGWFGCNRVDNRPSSPSVLRNRVTTRHFAATATRSCSRMIFDTAATISGVSPAARRLRAAPSTASDSSQSRNSPTVIAAIGAKAS